MQVINDLIRLDRSVASTVTYDDTYTFVRHASVTRGVDALFEVVIL